MIGTMQPYVRRGKIVALIGVIDNTVSPVINRIGIGIIVAGNPGGQGRSKAGSGPKVFVEEKDLRITEIGDDQERDTN